MGNESGWGSNFEALEKEIRKADPTRPIHYEDSKLARRTLAGGHHVSECDFVSNMYASPEDIEAFAKEIKDRPIILCEYSHAMGNHGGLKSYWDVINRYPNLQGGFIWDWVDQGLQRISPTGETYYVYGGDFNDHPNDKNFCLNGLIYPDRRVSPGLIEARKLYQKVWIAPSDLSRRTVQITNRFSFTDLREFDFTWELKQNGEVLSSGQIPNFVLAPYTSTEVEIPYILDTLQNRGELFLHLTFHLKNDETWASKGHVIASEQIELPYNKVKAIHSPVNLPFRSPVTTTTNDLRVQGTEFQVQFDKKTGKLTSYQFKGKELIEEGPRANFWRPYTDNDERDARGLEHWRLASLDQLTERMHEFKLLQETESQVIIGTRTTFANPSNQIVADVHYRYTIGGSGWIQIDTRVHFHGIVKYLPKIGLQSRVPAHLNQFAWYGKGPHETYPDQQSAGVVDLYSMPVKELWENYIVPQENGNRSNTRWCSITNEDGLGFLVQSKDLFHTSAHSYTDEMITSARHTIDLTPQKFVTWNLDVAQAGLGTAACGPGTRDEYIELAQPRAFSFLFIPIDNGKTGALENYPASIPESEIKVTAKPEIHVKGEGLNHQVKISVPSGSEVYYTLDGSFPSPGNGNKYTRAFMLDRSANIQAVAYQKGTSCSFLSSYTLHMINAKTIIFKNPPHPSGIVSETALLDGKPGTRGEPSTWVNFRNVDLEMEVAFIRPMNIRELVLHCYHDWYHRGFLPEKIVFSVSTDGKTYEKVGEHLTNIDEHYWTIFQKAYTSPVNKQGITHLKIEATNPKRYPSWFDWDFTDVNMFISELEIVE